MFRGFFVVVWFNSNNDGHNNMFIIIRKTDVRHLLVYGIIGGKVGLEIIEITRVF